MKDEAGAIIYSMRRRVFWKCIGPVLCCLATTSLSAQEKAVVGINVFPPAVRLDSARDFQTIIVQATREDSVTEDVTRAAKMAFKPAPKICIKRKRVHKQSFYRKRTSDFHYDHAVQFSCSSHGVLLQELPGGTDHDLYMDKLRHF